jgi:hypothetical protein
VNAEAVEGDECRGEEEGGDSDQDRTVGALQSVPQLSVMRQLSVSDGVVGRGCGAGRRAVHLGRVIAAQQGRITHPGSHH